jgi:hypothetical protein
MSSVCVCRVEQVTTDEETQARFLADKLRWPGGFKLRLALALIRYYIPMYLGMFNYCYN